MISYKEVLKTVSLLPVIIGMLGNGYLIFIYGFHFITQTRSKHIDLILMNLVFVNIMFLLFRGSYSVINSWGLNYVLNCFAYKSIIYLNRVCRGISLCSTCLLTVYQSIVISPNSPNWAALKDKGLKYIFPCCVLCWILNLLMDIVIPIYMLGLRNRTNIKGRTLVHYCSLYPFTENVSKIQVWKSIYDTLIVVLMAMASGYMAYVLYKHHQRIRHIHSTSLTPRTSPEIRATKLILMLVGIFFLFNTTSFIFITCPDCTRERGPWLGYISVITSMYFQAFSPFVLISSDTRIPQIFYGLLQRMKNSSTTPSCTISHEILKKA